MLDVGDVSLLAVVEMPAVSSDVLVRLMMLVVTMSLVHSPGGAVDGRANSVVVVII